MANSKSEIVVYSGPDQAALAARSEPVTARNAPAIVKAAGRSAEFAWEEFFQAEIANAHTRKDYLHAVRKFLTWVRGAASSCRDHPRRRRRVPPSLGLERPDQEAPPGGAETLLRPSGQPPRLRHQPSGDRQGRALRGRRGQDARDRRRAGTALLKSIDVSNPVGLRDRAVLAVLVYTAARVGAVAKLTLKSLKHDGAQYTLRFAEKGGKGGSRGGAARALLAALVPGDDRDRPVGLEQNVPLEDVQYLAGHSDPRTTRIYDRRRRKVTRNIVERISI